jgi:hypothetical protein
MYHVCVTSDSPASASAGSRAPSRARRGKCAACARRSRCCPIAEARCTGATRWMACSAASAATATARGAGGEVCSIETRHA